MSVNQSFPNLVALHREDKTKPRSRQKSNDSEHFRDVELAEALSREVAQNSLDAGNSKEVKLEISSHNLPRGAENILAESTDHEAHWLGSGLKKPFSTKRALVLSDYGTTGLKGSGDLDRDDADSWAYFFFSFGETSKNKAGKSGGSFGLGKVVLTLASQSATFFAYSHDGRTTRFMGISQLPPRSISGKPYLQTTYLAKGISKRGFAEPLQGNEADKAAALLGLTPRTEPGTTIVIIDPQRSLLTKKAHATISNSLAPLICLRNLKVTLFGESLDIGNLRHHVSQETQSLVSTSQDYQDLGEINIEDIDDDWLDRKAVEIKKGIRIRLYTKSNPDFFVDAWIKENPHLKDGLWKATRKSVVVGPPRSALRPGWTILVDIASDALSAFLVKQEGPSHQQWAPSRAVGSDRDISATTKLLKAPSFLIEKTSRQNSRCRRVSLDWASSLFGPPIAQDRGISPSGGETFGTSSRSPGSNNSHGIRHRVTMSKTGDIKIYMNGTPDSKAIIRMLIHPTSSPHERPLSMDVLSGCKAEIIADDKDINVLHVSLAEKEATVTLSGWDVNRMCNVKIEDIS